MNTSEQHRALVRRLRKPAPDVHDNMNYQQVDMIHACLGLAGETGEIVDLVKKHAINGHVMDTDKLAEEIGDVLFYLQLIAMATSRSLDEIMQENMDKLDRRYPQGYSDRASIARVDVT